MVLSQDTVHLLLTLQLVLKNALASLVKGFFALFSSPKSAKLASHSSPRVPASVEPIHAGCSAGGLRRVGEAQGTPRWQDLLLEQTY